MILTVTASDLDFVISYFRSLCDELAAAASKAALTAPQAEAFRQRCLSGARSSLEGHGIECPICRAMQLDRLDPLLWRERCEQCPVGEVCWLLPDSPYNRTIASLAGRDTAAASKAIEDGLALLADVRRQLAARGGSLSVEVPD